MFGVVKRKLNPLAKKMVGGQEMEGVKRKDTLRAKKIRQKEVNKNLG